MGSTEEADPKRSRSNLFEVGQGYKRLIQSLGYRIVTCWSTIVCSPSDNDMGVLTSFTTIPPRECAMNMIGRFRSSSVILMSVRAERRLDAWL